MCTGRLMGITNTIGTIPGFVTPALVGALIASEVFVSLLFHTLCTLIPIATSSFLLPPQIANGSLLPFATCSESSVLSGVLRKDLFRFLSLASIRHPYFAFDSPIPIHQVLWPCEFHAEFRNSGLQGPLNLSHALLMCV